MTEQTFTLKCPVCGRKDKRPASECVAKFEGDYPSCKHCYGIPMMLDRVTIKRGKRSAPESILLDSKYDR